MCLVVSWTVRTPQEQSYFIISGMKISDCRLAKSVPGTNVHVMQNEGKLKYARFFKQQLAGNRQIQLQQD